MAKRPWSKHQGREENSPNLHTGTQWPYLQHGKNLLTSAQSTSTPNNRNTSQIPQSINGHSRISSRCSVGLDGSVPAPPVLCRTGQRKTCVFLNAVLILLLVFDSSQTSVLVMVQLWHCFEMHCPVVFSPSTVLFAHKHAGVCVSFCCGAVAALKGQENLKQENLLL